MLSSLLLGGGGDHRGRLKGRGQAQVGEGAGDVAVEFAIAPAGGGRVEVPQVAADAVADVGKGRHGGHGWRARLRARRSRCHPGGGRYPEATSR